MASGESHAGERTEQPTAKRRDEARRRGQVAKSTDLTGAMLLLAGFGAWSLASGQLVADTVAAFRQGIGAAAHPDLTPGDAMVLFFGTTATIARIAWPFVLVPAVAAVAIQVLQTGFAASWELVTPQWTRVNPARGLGRLLSGTSLLEALKVTLKLVVFGWVAYTTVRDRWGLLLEPGPGASTLATIGAVAGALWLRIALAYFALAAIDYGHRWWQHHQSLKMTKEEVREESKETEGNPLLKSRMRALHRQQATRRMMADVKTADVVVRNPTHVAVALRYEGGAMRAPRVVAKGARLMAQRIIAAAVKHGVPVVENRPLARSLYRLVPVGREIPRELYAMVAEVLAHVYALRGRR
jgi:flagellar biosynthetic protein FlhB